MSSPNPVKPQLGTGLPPGVDVGPLGARLIAYLVDSVLPVVLGLLLIFALPGAGTARMVLAVIFVLLLLGWLLLVWRMVALRASSPGMRLMKLQVVGFFDGRPLGWGRAFLRGLILLVLSVSGVGAVLLLVFVLLHPRRQGWHDLAAKAVVIKARALAPVESAVGRGAVGAVDEDRSERAEVVEHAVLADSQDEDQDQDQDLDAPAGSHSVYGEAGGSMGPYQAQAELPVSSWIAELDDGREVMIEGLVLLGRNPQPQPGEEDAHLVKLADDTRTVSKTHIAIGLDAAGLFVVDRGSTNGSTVTTSAGVSSRASAGEIIYVHQESVVSIGDHWLRIRRAPS